MFIYFFVKRIQFLVKVSSSRNCVKMWVCLASSISHFASLELTFQFKLQLLELISRASCTAFEILVNDQIQFGCFFFLPCLAKYEWRNGCLSIDYWSESTRIFLSELQKHDETKEVVRILATYLTHTYTQNSLAKWNHVKWLLNPIHHSHYIDGLWFTLTITAYCTWSVIIIIVTHLQYYAKKVSAAK